MKTLEKLKTVLKDMEINEEQESALTDFFQEYGEIVNSKVKDELEAEYSEKLQDNSTVDETKYILKEDAEKAFELFKKDTEKAFELFQEDASKAFDLGMTDAEKAFDLGVEDLQEEFSEKCTAAIEETYETLQGKARQEFFESDEYKTFDKVKKLLLPIIVKEENISEEFSKLNADYEILKEEVDSMTREQTINHLVEDFPAKESKIIREWVEGAKTNDEIYERFQAIVEILEEKLDSNSDDDEDDQPVWTKRKKQYVEDDIEEDFDDEELDEEDDEELDEEDDEEFSEEDDSIFNSKTTEVFNESAEKLDGFRNHEKAIIKKAFNW